MPMVDVDGDVHLDFQRTMESESERGSYRFRGG